MNVGKVLNTLSGSDMKILNNLVANWRKYHQPELATLDSYSELTEEDKRDYIQLGEILSEFGFIE
ncbi:hypothetical protein [Solibacillus ferritrahens]|uniref:hypothetical protein n=1 Tax=Solibacillus ferritrahens TaxID=3098620 RepID=UPI0030099B96